MTGGSCHDLKMCVDNMLLRMTLNLNAFLHQVQTHSPDDRQARVIDLRCILNSQPITFLLIS